MALLLALILAAALAYDPVLDDPVVYPPDVLPGDPVSSGDLRVDGGGALVLRHTEVVAFVHAGVARVTVTQFFQNPYDEGLEATYLFPLPEDAAVDRMDLTIGDRTVEGWVMEREAARQAYEQAKTDGRRAALLEQERDNLFTQHVAGICPGDTIEVTLEYTEPVDYEDGLYTLAFPTTVGERFSPPWVEDAHRVTPGYGRTGRSVDITVYLDEGKPVETLYSDSHVIDVAAEGTWGAEVTLDPSEGLPDRDFVLTWSLAGTQPRAAVLAHRPDPGEPGYAAVTIEPQILGDLFQARPRELLFVVDESCSMSGAPYDTAAAAVGLALEEMRPTDTFNLVKFSDSASSLFRTPQPSTPATRRAAADWLGQFGGGGTNMDAGLVHSFTMPGDPDHLRLVLLLTDGFISGEKPMFEVVRDHAGDARVFALGVGSSVNRFLLEGLVEMGRGDVIYKLPGTRLDEAVGTFYDRIAHPGMSHVALDWGDVEVTGQYPSRIPDLWAGQPIRVVGRYEGSGPTTVTVTGIVGTDRMRLRLPVTFPDRELRHPGIATLWARERIRDIEWYPGDRTEGEIRDEVVEVALEHHLVSTYTSLVAIDEEPCWCMETLRQHAVLHEGPRGTRMQGSGYGLGSGSGYGGSAHGYGIGRFSTGVRGGGRRAPTVADAEPVRPAVRPLVLGGLDRRSIERVIRQHRSGIRYCYQRELQRDPDLGGRLVVDFVIGRRGEVASASIESSTLDSEEVGRCVAGRFARMRFPPVSGGGIVVVRYPLRFARE